MQSSPIEINLVFSASVIASFAVNAVFLLLCEVCDFTASKWQSPDCLYFFYYLPTAVFLLHLHVYILKSVQTIGTQPQVAIQRKKCTNPVDKDPGHNDPRKKIKQQIVTKEEINFL